MSQFRAFPSQVAALSLLALVALLTVSAGTASAGVPKDDFACYGEAGTYIATLEIQSSKKYSYLGEVGKYELNGKVLKFKSGPLKKWVGRSYKDDGDPAIDLVTKQAGGQTVNCTV